MSLDEVSDLIEHDGDDDIAPIYTSEDERDFLPPNPSESNAADPVQMADNKSDKSSSSRNSSDVEAVEIPVKKPKLAAASLVSYAIDEDDDEATAPTEDESDQSQSSASPAKVPQPELVQYDVNTESIINASPTLDEHTELPFNSLNEPPTILSADQQTQESKPVISEQPPVSASSNVESDQPISTRFDRNQIERLLESVQLPPEPTGHCSMKLQEKVDREVHRMRLEIDYDPNRAIQDNKAFRNPSIYEKLISFLNIDEKGTNFPSEVYNPYRWSPQSYYEELVRVQNREMAKLMKEQPKGESGSVDNTKTAPPTITKASSQPVLTTLAGFAEPKKRSKWDSEQPTNPAHDVAKNAASTVGTLVKQT